MASTVPKRSIRIDARGVSLLELVVAVVFFSIVALSGSLFMSRATQSAVSGSNVTIAKNLATTEIQELKTIPYGYVVLTDTTSLAGVSNCDCSQLDITRLAPLDVRSANGVSYSRYVCVNLVQPAAGGIDGVTPVCPDFPLTNARDAGIKSIRVAVAWATPSAATQTITIGSLVNR